MLELTAEPRAVRRLSYIAAGAVSKIGTTVLFLASGVTVVAVTTVLFRSPQFWRKE
jgi:hypothetical protein